MADAGPLSGRSAVVTGASRGIGLAVSQALAKAGARVLMVARNEDALVRAAAYAGGIAVTADLTDSASVERLAGRVRETFGSEGPDVLVNAAGAFELAAVAETEPASFDRILAVNLRGAFLLIRVFLAGMLNRRSGHVVTVGSIAGRVPFVANGAYAASKFGVRGLHAVLDLELRGTGVRATLIEPAATDTPLWDGVNRVKHPELPQREHMLSAEAVADAVLFAVTRPPEIDVRTIILERA